MLVFWGCKKVLQSDFLQQQDCLYCLPVLEAEISGGPAQLWRLLRAVREPELCCSPASGSFQVSPLALAAPQMLFLCVCLCLNSALPKTSVMLKKGFSLLQCAASMLLNYNSPTNKTTGFLPP